VGNQRNSAKEKQALSTPVELYLDSKQIEYTLNGINAVIRCPVCKQDEQQCAINIDNWLWSCLRGKCAAKGNEKTFKKLFGDSVERASNFEDDAAQATQTAPSTRRIANVEKIPNYEAAHQNLLTNDAVLNFLNDERGLGIDVVKSQKLGLGKRRFGAKGTDATDALMFPYFVGTECVGVKYRSLPPEPKDFRFTSGRELGLYRQNVITEGMESLCMCEGEVDTLTLVDAGMDNVVGVPGCEGKKVSWDAMLNLPEKMYLVFDNDEAGQHGALAFATRFGMDKFHNVLIPNLPLDTPIGDRTTIKDVNEFFTTGHTLEDFKQLLAVSKPFDIEGVTTMDSAFNDLLDRFDATGSLAPKYSFLWPTIQQRAKGIDEGDMIVILAAAKTGKTTACLNQCEFMCSEYGLSIHFDCMEMDASALVKKWTAMMMQKDEDTLTRADIVEGQKIAHDREYNFIFTRSTPKSLDDYLEFLRAISRRYGTKVRILDNFQILVDLTIGNYQQRPSYMSMVSKKIKALAGELKEVIFLISQPKQLQDGQMVGVNDSEGSSTLTKDADLFFTLNRAPEGKMTQAQAVTCQNIETNQSHSDTMWVSLGLSRRSPGGMCTLKIDGAKSLIREFNAEENVATTKQGYINGIKQTTDIVEEGKAAA
jgi:hypothetical protein